MKRGKLMIVSLETILISAIFVPSGSFANNQIRQAWVARYDGPASGADGATSMALDRHGNIYITGYSQGNSSGLDYATIKYSPAGEQLWVAGYNGPGNSDDLARSIALDPNGNVYVTGPSCGSGTSYDYATIKYDSAGAEQWVALYNGPGNGDDIAVSLAIDGCGFPCVTGWSWGVGTQGDYATIKYDTQGNELWVSRYNGTGNGVDTASAVAADARGNVYVTGVSPGTGPAYFDYATVKYDSAGNESWVARFDGYYPGYHYFNWAKDVAVDAGGNVYVTGTTFSPMVWDWATLKYDSEGVQQWQAIFDDGDDYAQALTLDTCGNVYVTGKSMYINDYDIYTFKYNSAGAQQWGNWFYYPGPDDYAYAVAADAHGNAFVAGKSGSDYVTLKCSRNMEPDWAETYNGPGNGNDMAVAVAVDDSGNIYVTGSSDGNGTNLDFATIRYTPIPSVTLAPLNPPLEIPASGGRFGFSIHLGNGTYIPQTFDAWIMVRLPNQSWYGPLLGPLTLTLPAGSSITRQRTQTVPGWAPAGDYLYEARVGDYPGAVWDTSGFTFTKLGFGTQDSGIGEWSCTGEPFPGEEVVCPQPSAFSLQPCSPNPFNPTTAISYELRAASYVSLRVYDTTGRLVTILVEGMREAGTHEVTFDGSRLASGIYLAKLEAGDFTAVQKLVLMK